MGSGVNGRIFQSAMVLVVKVLKLRADHVLSQLVVESHAMVLGFSLQHVILVCVVQVS